MALKMCPDAGLRGFSPGAALGGVFPDRGEKCLSTPFFPYTDPPRPEP
jgi:hypothetical protein